MWLPLIAEAGRPTTSSSRRTCAASAIRPKPAGGYDKKTMAQDIHALVNRWLQKVNMVGHDIGLMVAYAYAAQYPDEVESIVLMDAFLPGVGDWKKVWLLRDKWHFHFYGETPLKLVEGRERIYFEHFWNDFAADREPLGLGGGSRVLRGRLRAARRACAPASNTSAPSSRTRRISPDSRKRRCTMPMLVLRGEKAGGQFLIDQGGWSTRMCRA